MTQQVQDILNSALALSDEEQAELVTALLSAVDEQGLRPFDDATLAEIQRRSAEYDAGGITTIPWNIAKEMARNEVEGRG